MTVEDSVEILRRIYKKVAERIEEDPVGAADDLEKMAAKFMEASRALRKYAEEGMMSKSGFGDRVLIQVVGQDGKVKRFVDTGG